MLRQSLVRPCQTASSSLTDNFPTAQDKQKRLLEQPNPGHFSMIRALHLADLITLGNGTITTTHALSLAMSTPLTQPQASAA